MWNGLGVFTWGRGKKQFDSYEGDWQNGNRHGFGISQECLGDLKATGTSNVGRKKWKRYTGSWIEDRMEGFGKFTWDEEENPANRKQILVREYEGQWHNGLREGYGKLTKSNKDTFEGIWRGDKPWNGTWKPHNGGCITVEDGKLTTWGSIARLWKSLDC